MVLTTAESVLDGLDVPQVETGITTQQYPHVLRVQLLRSERNGLPAKKDLEERRAAANEEFSDLLMKLSSGSVPVRFADSRTKKDLAWETMKAAERALDEHTKEHGC